MNVGEYKGRIMTDLIQVEKPEVMVELGGYIGYSSILFGDAFRNSGGKRYFTLESSPEFAAVIMALVKLAGLSGVVEVIVGDSADSLERLHRERGLSHVDILFIDHTEFERDAKLCERLGMISPGTVLAADNCVYPGHPEYWNYVTASVQEKKAAFNREEDQKMRGNPHLVYESRLAYGFEPSGEKVKLMWSYAETTTDQNAGCSWYHELCGSSCEVLTLRPVCRDLQTVELFTGCYNAVSTA